jgi:indolepyruvate decarboxylase
MTEKHPSETASRRQTVGEFIIRRLGEVGICHLFGVPGDYNLEFLEQVEAAERLT